MEAITRIVQHYFPQWEPPANRREWNACLCPSHAEDRASCAVNYAAGAIKCQACDFRGNVISIVQRKEGISYRAAIEYAAELLAGSGIEIPQQHQRQSGRAVFGEPRDSRTGNSQPVRTRFRG